MKLLFITQKVDKNDAVLGFIHRWLELFAKNFEHITVICLYQGETQLPGNITVLSLGKEHGVSRIKYIYRFFKYSWQYRNEYDAVFVHMNSEYVILGWWLWKLLGKKYGLWYNHTFGNWKSSLAFMFADLLFHTSPYALSANTPKSIRMPAGIDTELFIHQPHAAKPNSVLYVGRLSAVKHVDVLIEAIKRLRAEGLDVTLDIIGEAGVHDTTYEAELHQRGQELERQGVITYHGSVANRLTPKIYSEHQIVVNLTPRGNYDKTVLEALACEKISVVSSEAFAGIVPEQFIFQENNVVSLAETIKRALNIPESEKQALGRIGRNNVVLQESIITLIKKISEIYNGPIKGADVFRPLRYIIAGVLATGADLVLLYIFTDWFGLWYMFSATVAFAIALSISFVLQKYWTFKDKATDRIHHQIILYVATGLFSIGLNSILLYSLVEFLHIHYILSQIVGNVVVAIVNFIIYQWLIFRLHTK